MSRRRRFSRCLEDFFIAATSAAYSNLGRLFLRLFVGVMLIQFGIRHLLQYSEIVPEFPQVWGMSSSTSLIVMIVIELVCSLLIMVGFLTRPACVPPVVAMIVAEHHILTTMVPETSTFGLASTQPGYLPIMFIGIYVFLLIAGPGKISLDYFISYFMAMKRTRVDRRSVEEM